MALNIICILVACVALVIAVLALKKARDVKPVASTVVNREISVKEIKEGDKLVFGNHYLELKNGEIRTDCGIASESYICAGRISKSE